MSAKAYINAVGGRAIIREEGGKTYILDIEQANGVQDGEGVHLGMFLQPGMNPIEERDAGTYPFAETMNYLDLAHRRHLALTLFLTTLDAEMSTGLRQACASEVEDLLADEAISSWVEQTFLSVPIPETADTENGPRTGKAGYILAEGIRKWRGT